MEQPETPPDISEAIARIAEKLKNKQKITIKTPTNPITQGFLLSQIIIHSDLSKSCILFLVKDDIAKLGIITSIKHWTKNEKKMPLHPTLSTTALADIKDNKACLVILTQEEAKQNLPSKKTFEAHTINLKKAQKLSKEHLLKKLVDSGYTLERTAQESGIASSRGSIVDICTLESRHIIRVDFDDEIIESIKTITQDKKLETKEVAQTRIIPYSLDHIEHNSHGFAPESGRFAPESGRFAPSGLVAGSDDPKSDPAAEIGSDKAASERRAAAGKSGRFAPSGLVAGSTGAKSDPAAEIGSDKTADSENDKAAIKKATYRVQLNEYNPKIKHIICDPFPREYDIETCFTQKDAQLLAKLSQPAHDVRAKHALPSFIKNLQIGDYVVHLDHGIARFEGMVEQKIGNITREYFKLCYAQEDALFLPVTSAEKMEKYIGDPNPTLNRLSSNSWGKQLSKASLDTLHHARELLNTQAKRQLSKAIEIPRAKNIENDLAKTFAYDETEDQKKVIETIYQDLEQDTPMDRLVCGDVGFGKTEVAIRASAKVALEGFQVAVLSPTTILTQQHIDTFTDRLKHTPLKVASLSRFQSKQEQQEVIENLGKGKIDIIIGTHRILSQDVKFKNLGLIVVDEEQRFGVSHKEQLKKLRSQSHVLTLTATPIPRTLHLAVSGVRAISNITTPPCGRKPIETIIEPYNQKHIASAIQEEIKRKGQVYYLYNKVETMHLKKQELQELLPKIRIGMLHGQMPEQEMAKQMHAFDKKKIDVLVCSTIIENGVDLPNVNTLIIDNATQFGLSQLHQIRGRIGRGKRQAYAYFFFRRQKLTGEAEKRLNALEAAKELGSGFDIAQADMEIRGVGNVLGKSQHGHVKSIGLGLYLRLLNNAVEEIKSGTPSEMLSEISVDLPIEARIPKFFEPDKQKRIEMYHQWALLDSIDDLNEAKDKLLAQGALPKPIENLFYILGLKILGIKAGIEAIDTAYASQTSPDQYVILRTHHPTDPKTFAKMLEICQHWQYGTDEIKVLKKDMGADWMKKLEKSIKVLL
ncbi:MAG: hypothetical protein CO042_02750 [Parcubacteria group bacterium CG_4_9_14_0_2_um_filter_41_8]|nr:MAG: hypothetical protein CO042_02750 [Parcubacteria group bacterium CG_4_9_14_0_2_um_filter_41_8]